MGGLYAFLVLGIDIYLCHRAWTLFSHHAEARARQVARTKAVVLGLTIATLGTVQIGLYFRHSNPYEWSVFAYIWSGWHFWILTALGIFLERAAKERNSETLRIVSAGILFAPLLIGLAHHVFWDQLKVYFEYYR